MSKVEGKVESPPPPPGSYGVVTTPGLFAGVIRRGTHSRVNHAFIVVNDGQLVEMTRQGAAHAPLSKYPDATVMLGQPLTDEQRIIIVEAAEGLVARKVAYSLADIASLGLRDLLKMRSTRLRNYIADSGHMICSQAVDWCHMQAGVHLFDDRWEGEVQPDDLDVLGLTQGWHRAPRPMSGFATGAAEVGLPA